MSYLWGRWNGAALHIDGLMVRTWRYRHRTSSRALAELRALGLIECIAPACSMRGQAHGAVYNIPLAVRRAAYLDDGGHFLCWADAVAGVRHRPRVEVQPPRLAELLKQLTFTWNGAAAWERLMQMHPLARHKAWKGISRYATGTGIRPSWGMTRVGRITASRPDVQNIPSDFRTAAVIAPGRELWEVDFKGQHAGIVRILRGMEPHPAPWAALADASGQDAAFCKAVINAHYGGQRPHTWAYNEREAGRKPDHDGYQRVIAAARELFMELPAADIQAVVGDLTPAADALQMIGAAIQDEALARYGPPPPMLLPLHDGFCMAGTEDDAARMADAMVQGSDTVMGLALNVEIEKKIDVP